MRIDRSKLACEMIRNDLNCNDLVRVSGLSRSTITAVRTGKSCSGNTAMAIARALGVSLESLIVEEVS